MKNITLFLIAALISCSIYSQTNEKMKEIPKYKHAVIMNHNIIINVGAEEIYNFIADEFSKVYTKTSNGHEYFTVRGGGEMQVGSIIDCKETADNQSIVHKYVVSEMIENERIFYYSKPSYSNTQLKKKIIEGQSNTYVYWDFKEKNDKETAVTIYIIVQFKNGFEKFLINNLFNGLKPWKKHCVEEMEGFKHVITEQINH
jgi:hypothetical protein